MHGNGRSSTPGERADTATKRLADMVENVFVKSKPVEKRAHAEPSATPLVLQQTLSAWVGLLLNGTIDVTFAPWFIITALNVRKENPGALITAVSLLIDGLISRECHLSRQMRNLGLSRHPQSSYFTLLFHVLVFWYRLQ